MPKVKIENQKAWLVAVDMGYGHQRTAYPLRHITFEGKVINANRYDGIPKKDRVIWRLLRDFYETISDIKRIPFVGGFLFSMYDQLQKIKSFYPKRDLSKPDISLKSLLFLIRLGWGKHLINKLNENPLPLITTFYAVAFMAEYYGYKGEIYCIICDADVSRAWAPYYPQQSKIKYFTPNSRTAERLQFYGIKAENVIKTGYPLPLENIGDEIKMEVLKHDLRNRIVNLDPSKKYRTQYDTLISDYLGQLPERSDHPLTIMFSIGGAGAQKEIIYRYLKSLSKKILDGEIKVILSVGIKKWVKQFLELEIKALGLESADIEILYEENIKNYFERFNQTLRKTDILWTKPSELSFYSGLGLPIIIAPSIGSQEDFNREWLLSLGPGVLPERPKYADQWIFDFLKIGVLAEAAMQGFIEVRKAGVYNIEKVINGEKDKINIGQEYVYRK